MKWTNTKIASTDARTNARMIFESLDETANHFHVTREYIRQRIVCKRLLFKRFRLERVENNKDLVSLH